MQLLHDYAAFAAWSYQQQLSNQLEETAWQVVNPVMHRQLHQGMGLPDAPDLIQYRNQSLLECRCDPVTRPSTYFAFSLGSDTLGTAGEPLDRAGREAVNRYLTHHLRSPPEGRDLNRIAVLGPVENLPSLLAYGLMPTVRLDTIVYGFVFDSASLAPTFTSVLARADLLPEAVSRGRASQEMLALQVLDANGRMLYRDPRWPEGTITAEERLP